MSDFWRGKKVSLLGGASLIGVHLAQRLMALGAQVRMADDLSAGKMSNIDHLRRQGMEFFKADLRNYTNAFGSVVGSDFVFHLAAQHGGRGYVATHKVELYDNLSLDTTIFRACADARVGRVIFSSSACAYPIDLQTNSDEFVYLSEGAIDYSNIRQADGAYGTEKLLGEIMLDAYIERGDFKGCSTRSFTVYGPLMGETHAIAAFIAKTMLKQDPFEVWGNGRQVRNWTFVEDNVSGALLAAEHLNRGAINIGVEERLTPALATGIIWDLMGWHPETVRTDETKPTGPQNRVADSTKLKSLGWQPYYTFRKGLEKTIEWYVANHSAASLRYDLERRLTER